MFYTPLHSILYNKTGVYRGLHYFLIFALTLILWLLNEAVLTCTHNICFEQKYENSQNISNKKLSFLQPSKIAVYCMGVFLMYICLVSAL